MGLAVVRHDAATARGVQWHGARRRRAEPGPARALGAAVPSGTARHGSTAVVPCLGRDLGTATRYGMARQRRRASPCRASACQCRAVPGRPVWTTITAWS